jgi:spore coat protein U-like protein
MYYDGALISASGDTVSSGASASAVARPITVTFPAAPSAADPGSYSDTVTFTISSP